MPPCVPNNSSMASCSPIFQEIQTVVADLDGGLLISPNPFPYFMLIAIEAGSLLRGLLLLLLSPLIHLLYTFVSEPTAIQLMIFISMFGLKIRDIRTTARAVLPRFYAADVREDSRQAFSGMYGRRIVVTSIPTVMVEPFATDFLGADRVLGTEIDVHPKSLRATGFVKTPGVLAGRWKKSAIKQEFGEESPDLGIGCGASDHDFVSLCKEGYIVHPDNSAVPVNPDHLNLRLIFHDGRLVQRPTYLNAIINYLWIPLGFILAIIRIFFLVPLPLSIMPRLSSFFGLKLITRGLPPPPPSSGSPGFLYVCNHRTAIDPLVISVALKRKISCVTYSLGHFSELMSPIRTFRLSRDRATDTARISALLKEGDLIICPEGTTCRQPFLLRFSALFAELSDRIVPVAVNIRQGMFFGSTARGWESMDPFFLFMNPRPTFEITFLDPMPTEMTCTGGRPSIDVANHVQRMLGCTLGFESTTLTRKDKYMMLTGHAGVVDHSSKMEPTKSQ
ncbi:glycerol-3-phosphate 2-O-acyltransferase 4-like isoform X2 [Magnolia sinica]|uniref:glycerol-3-phosphate 2-O-acyltransferase 4-like isoform X2 n=1 Tax=Magnolia sinica TaxID=86752 RepID=UPI00265A61E2|nr:glycerol-3-phosphate 2-O-acyltransferase 4-like isoform X2 [Magnolia sinica]